MAWFSKASTEKRKRAREKAKEVALEKKELKRIHKEAIKDSKLIERRLIRSSAQQGMKHIKRAAERPDLFDMFVLGERLIEKVKFDYVCMEESLLWFHIDAMNLPFRVELPDFQTEGFLITVGTAVQREVKYQWSAKNGAFIVVERDGSIAGIPMLVKMDDAFAAIPKNADPLTVMVGKAQHGKYIYGSLTEWQHLLIGGTTNSGKSVFLNQLLCTLILRNTPKQLQLMLVDLKKGVELGKYAKAPHLMYPIVKEASQVKAALGAFIDEMNRRGDMFNAEGCTNIDEWNQRHKERLGYIVLVIDELSRLLFNSEKEVRLLSKHLLNEVLSVARAFGMHVILCTQEPSKEVVPSYLKNNCPARLCFSVPGIHGSIAMLGNKAAHRLSPKGRAVFQYGDQEVMIQAPKISPTGVRKAVKIATDASGDESETTPQLGLYDLLEYAHENLDDRLSWRELLPVFQSKGVSERRIKDLLRDADDSTVEIDGQQYTIKNEKVKGRHLVLTDESIIEPESIAAD